MYDRNFFRTKLGKASLASIGAMTAMIALTSQMNLVAESASDLASPRSAPSYTLVELA